MRKKKIEGDKFNGFCIHLFSPSFVSHIRFIQAGVHVSESHHYKANQHQYDTEAAMQTSCTLR